MYPPAFHSFSMRTRSTMNALRFFLEMTSLSLCSFLFYFSSCIIIIIYILFLLYFVCICKLGQSNQWFSYDLFFFCFSVPFFFGHYFYFAFILYRVNYNNHP